MDTCPLQYAAPTLTPFSVVTRLAKSVILNGHGDFSKIKIDEEARLPIPLEDDEVEVRIHYCGLNFTDNYLRLGIIRNQKFPVIMGSECSGYVTDVGKKVKDLQAGNKVLCLRMQGGLFRDQVHIPRKFCFRVPDDMDLKDAVALGFNFLVARILLFDIGHLQPNSRVFMQSIGGGVGTAVVELCKTVENVDVFGTASEMKHDDLLTLGMRRVYMPEENYVDRMLRLFPEGADIVINSNGGTDGEKCRKLLKQCGTLINIGSNSTACYPRSTPWTLKKPEWDYELISTAELINKTYRVAGFNVGSWLENYPRKVNNIVMEIFSLYREKVIKPCIHSVIPFSEVTDGMKEMCERKNYGKIILDLEKTTTFVMWKVPGASESEPVTQQKEPVTQQKQHPELKRLCAHTLKESPQKKHREDPDGSSTS